jgi:hypothetical protein
VSNAPGGSPPPADGPVGHSPLGTPSGDPEQAEALATELSHDLMSPYCPGRTIATCPSPQARKLEALILEQAQAGKSPRRDRDGARRALPRHPRLCRPPRDHLRHRPSSP